MVLKELEKKYSNRKINWINDDNDILYDQYGFHENGFMIYMDLIKMG